MLQSGALLIKFQLLSSITNPSCSECMLPHSLVDGAMDSSLVQARGRKKGTLKFHFLQVKGRDVLSTVKVGTVLNFPLRKQHVGTVLGAAS